MAEPAPGFYQNNSSPSTGTPLNDLSPVNFGLVPRASIVNPLAALNFPFHLWNDKGGGILPKMEDVEILIKNPAGGDTGQILVGTAGNGNLPFYEVKSSGSLGCNDDAQSDFSPVGALVALAIGDIPANARRSLHVRMNLPYDAANGSLSALIIVDYTFTP
jgi:hypothetical protein